MRKQESRRKEIVMSNSKKDVDYQLDLTPFISLLSVCICFLLLTVAWFQIGALTVKQVMGGDTQRAEEKKDKVSLWIYIKAQKKIEIRLKKSGKSLSEEFINSSDKAETFDFKKFKKYITDLKKKQSDLNEVFIFPQEQSVYEDIVKIMDSARQAGIFNIGLSPI